MEMSKTQQDSLYLLMAIGKSSTAKQSVQAR